MISDKKRLIEDIFGDDEGDIEQSQNGGCDDKGRHYTEGKADTSEGLKGADSKKLHANGNAPAPERPKKKKKLEKVAKPVEGGEVTGHDPELTMEQKRLNLERDFELAIKSVQSTRTKRKKNDEDIETKLNQSAARFVAKMQDTALQDMNAKMKGQVPVAKVKMLEDVKDQLNKFDLHNTFLDNGVLTSMKLWLEPLGTSLPSLNIIQDFLDILDVLPIQTHHLSSSGVGRVVYFYTLADESRVTRDINRKARSLVDKWSGPILNRSQDFKTKKIIYAEVDVPPASKRRRNSNNIVAAASSKPTQQAMGVRELQTDHRGYALLPEPSITCDKSRRGKSDKYRKLKSHMTKIKRS